MLNWGVISAGGIAYVFCNAMRFTNTGQIVAIASNTESRADKFVNDFGIPRQYSNYADLLADDEVDAVYISTIHPRHMEWTIRAAEAKKHILVEKPIAMNRHEAGAMVAAARVNDVFLMEAFMYRCHPQIERVVQLIQDGAIGEIRAIRATFGFHSSFNPESRLYNRRMGGGGILDIGCYTASMARKLAGAADGEPFLNPVEMKGNGRIGSTGVDQIAVANLKFENGIVAEIACAIECNFGSSVYIYGSEGIITIPTPWVPSSPCRHAREPLPPDTTFPPTKIIVERYQTRESSEITVNVDRDLFSYEADMVANHIEERQAPAMPWADTLGNMDLLDDWLNQVWGA